MSTLAHSTHKEIIPIQGNMMKPSCTTVTMYMYMYFFYIHNILYLFLSNVVTVTKNTCCTDCWGWLQGFLWRNIM